MASIGKRGDKWHVRICRKDHPTVCKSFSLLKDAQTWAKNTELKLERGKALGRETVLLSTLLLVTVGCCPSGTHDGSAPCSPSVIICCRSDATSISEMRRAAIPAGSDYCAAVPPTAETTRSGASIYGLFSITFHPGIRMSQGRWTASSHRRRRPATGASPSFAARR